MSAIFAPSRLYLPAGSRSFVQPGHIDVLADKSMREALGITLGFEGGDRGFNQQSDVVTQTADGVDLNTVWRDFQAVLQAYNARRNNLISFLTYSVSNPTETVMQATGGDDFEVASEYGVPKSVRTRMSSFQMGFPFEWYDIAGRFTWKFLMDATLAQVDSVHNAIVEADNRLVFGEVFKTLFDPTNRVADILERPYTVYALYNGDGTVPPAYKSTTFSGTHSHYMVSGAAALRGQDLDALLNNITEHGFDAASGATLIVMVNKQESNRIRNFRNIANLSATAAAVDSGAYAATYDFIPAQGTPSLLMPRDMIVGQAQQPANTYQGLKVVGAYGDALVVEEDYIPAGYLVAFATGGSNNLTNPLGIREHANAAYRGLRLVKTRETNSYPLQDSYYQRGFGVGIRQRGSAALMQVKASGTYAVPAAYAR